MSEFLAMGGYAIYVWSAYGVAAVVMIALLAASLTALRRRQEDVRMLEAARGEARDATPAAMPERSR